MNIGAKVTLRSDRMYEFTDKLFNVFALPRVRDFRGLSNKSFDGRGNYAFGIKEQLISLKLIMTRLNRFAVWTSCLSQRQKQMKKLTNC